MQFNQTNNNAGAVVNVDMPAEAEGWCDAIARILDGRDNGTGTCAEPWETTRRRLFELVKQANEVAFDSIAVADLQCEIERLKNGGAGLILAERQRQIMQADQPTYVHFTVSAAASPPMCNRCGKFMPDYDVSVLAARLGAAVLGLRRGWGSGEAGEGEH